MVHPNIRHPAGRRDLVLNRAIPFLQRLAPLCAVALASASAHAQATNSSYGHGFGVMSLAPAQAQKVWIGAAYQLLLVCNDLRSNGTAVVVIDGHQPETLRPGICTQDYGNTIEVTNRGPATATITYRTIFEPPPP